MSNCRFVKAVTVLSLLSFPLFSTPVTFEDNLGGEIYLGNGATVQGTFDIGSGYSSINNAVIEYTFHDDNDKFLGWISEGNFVYVPEGGYHQQNNTLYYLDDGEAVLVSVGDEISGAQTEWYLRESLVSVVDLISEYEREWFPESYFVFTYENVSGFGGELLISQHLGSNALSDLVSDGQISYTAMASFGDICFTNAVLRADVSPTESVPEPASIILLLFGGIGTGLVSMLKRRKTS